MVVISHYVFHKIAHHEKYLFFIETLFEYEIDYIVESLAISDQWIPF